MTATMSRTPAMSTRMPARAICRTEIIPEPNTMALGGVATGSMKPVDDENHYTSISSTGG